LLLWQHLLDDITRLPQHRRGIHLRALRWRRRAMLWHRPEPHLQSRAVVLASRRRRRRIPLLLAKAEQGEPRIHDVGRVLASWISFCICHHGSHHWNTKRGWLQRMKRHHLAHHGHSQYNWGFTSPIWDLVFRTYYRGPVRRVESADGRPPQQTASGPVAISVGRRPT
jgi:hypothetical protein